MSVLEWPYEVPNYEDDHDFYLAEHQNRQDRQIQVLTQRVNRFWVDDDHRPEPVDPSDRYPIGFNISRNTYEFFNGAIWIQVNSALVNTFLGLLDTPNSFSGQSGKLLAVNTSESGIEFIEGGGGFVPYVGSFEQPEPPTPLQVPNGAFAFWIDTDDGDAMYFVRNRGNVIKAVEMTAV